METDSPPGELASWIAEVQVFGVHSGHAAEGERFRFYDDGGLEVEANGAGTDRECEGEVEHASVAAPGSDERGEGPGEGSDVVDSIEDDGCC